MTKVLITFLFSFCLLEVEAQRLFFGAGFGFNIRNNIGTNVVSDSITINAEGSQSMLNVYSLFMEYNLKDYFQLRNSINLTDQLNGFTMYNHQAACKFCPVTKATTVGSINLNMVNEVSIKIPTRSSVVFYLLGGIRTNVTFTKDEPDISFRDGTRHEGLAEAINNLDQTIKPVYVNSIFGIKSEWKRFSLVFEFDQNIGKSITTDLEMFGKKYTFLNGTRTFTLTANYKIIPFKEKNKPLKE